MRLLRIGKWSNLYTTVCEITKQQNSGLHKKLLSLTGQDENNYFEKSANATAVQRRLKIYCMWTTITELFMPKKLFDSASLNLSVPDSIKSSSD